MKHYVILFMILGLTVLSGCGDSNVDKQVYYEKGMAYLEKGNANGAIIAFKKAIEKDGGFHKARYELASAYLMKQKYESAERELQWLQESAPELIGAHLLMARTYLKTGHPQKAYLEINKYLKRKSDNAEAYELAALAHIALNEYGKAEKAGNRSLELEPGRISSRIIIAEAFFMEHKIDDAEEIVRAVLKEDKDHRKALLLSAKIMKRRGDIDDMIAVYEQLIELEPDNLSVHMELGLTYLHKDDIEKARFIAEKMKEINPKRPEWSYIQGLIYYKQRKFDDAIVSLQASLKYASNPGAHYYLGLCHFYKNNLEQATSEMQRVIDLRPDLIEARLMLAVTHLKKKRPEEAEREALLILSRDENNAFAHNVLGSAYMALGKSEEAMREFDRAIELNPGLVDAHVKKGAFELLSGDGKKAESEFVHAVKIAPEMLNTRVILAQYYMKSKRFDDAVSVLREGIKDSAEDAVVYNLMGSAYLGAGNTTEALAHFEKSKAANPEFYLPYLNIARTYLGLKEQEKAVNEYKSVLERDSSNIPALITLARIMESDNNDKEALYFYEKATEHGGSEASIMLAGYHQKKGEHGKAVEALDRALLSDPDNARLLDMLGRVYFADKQYEKALSVFERLEKHVAGMGAKRIVTLFAATGEYDKSINKLDALLEDHPGNPALMEQIVRINLKKKDYKEAEKRAGDMIGTMPESDYGHHILADVYLKQGKWERAVETLSEAEKIKPDSLKTLIMKGKAYTAGKKYRNAIDLFGAIQKAHPEYAPAYFFEANTYELMGESGPAVKKHQETIRKFPDYVPSLNNLAYLYISGHGSLDEAVKMAREAKKLAPLDGHLTDTLGWALYHKGSYDEALSHFLEASQILPEEPAIHYHIGLVYGRKGMGREAQESFAKAIELGNVTPFPELSAARSELEKYKAK